MAMFGNEKKENQRREFRDIKPIVKKGEGVLPTFLKEK
jgi:hypothetical protein